MNFNLEPTACLIFFLKRVIEKTNVTGHFVAPRIIGGLLITSYET